MPIFLAVRMMRHAISPRLAIRSRAIRAGSLMLLLPSHPEQAEPGWFGRRGPAGTQCQSQHPARVRRIDDSVVPETRGRIIWMSLTLVLIADRRAECLFLLRAPAAALRLDRVPPQHRQHRGRLLAAHHRDPRIRPHPQEARRIGPAAHAVIAGTVAAPDNDRV